MSMKYDAQYTSLDWFRHGKCDKALARFASRMNRTHDMDIHVKLLKNGYLNVKLRCGSYKPLKSYDHIGTIMCANPEFTDEDIANLISHMIIAYFDDTEGDIMVP